MQKTELEIALEEFKMLDRATSKQSIKEIYDVLAGRLLEISSANEFIRENENKENLVRVYIYLGAKRVGSIFIALNNFEERIDIYLTIEEVDRHSEKFYISTSEHFVSTVVPNSQDREIIKVGMLANENFIDELVSKTLNFIIEKVSK